jgi:hypothetical protein
MGVPIMVVRADASPYIEVHFSIKIIRDPILGLRPSMDPDDPGAFITDIGIRRIFSRINANDSLMAGYQRGYRYVVDEIVEIGSLCPLGCVDTNPSYWYGVLFDGISMKAFETRARDNQVAFQWKANAVNVYVNWGHGNGAIASFPPPDNRSNHVVVVGSRVLDPDFIPTFAAASVAHEMGHYFGLPHTNLEDCKPEVCYTPDCPNPVPGDGDNFGDTLPDHPCWGLNQLSQYHFNKIYLFLSPGEREAIDNIFWNNMSYLHPSQAYGQTFMYRRTENQLDHFSDVASFDTSRVAVRGGRTWAVSPVGSISGTGACTNPFRWPSQGKAAANVTGRDIILFRPGTYTENLVFDHPVTLRVTRNGVARIGN